MPEIAIKSATDAVRQLWKEVAGSEQIAGADEFEDEATEEIGLKEAASTGDGLLIPDNAEFKSTLLKLAELPLTQRSSTVTTLKHDKTKWHSQYE